MAAVSRPDPFPPLTAQDLELGSEHWLGARQAALTGFLRSAGRISMLQFFLDYEGRCYDALIMCIAIEEMENAKTVRT